jgi:hypothetical protein
LFLFEKQYAALQLALCFYRNREQYRCRAENVSKTHGARQRKKDRPKAVYLAE